ncbi:MAG: nucleotidyltransferase domain-containing protein [Oligoflexia bacterium]|nr:nucleotidyltransferase domain-containing protein [Oligoflexia bacterium]
MRLSKKELEAIKKTFLPLNTDVYLFGSRIDNSAKGGDIDILLFLDLDEDKRFELIRKLSLDFFRECEEKIDIVIFNKENLSNSDLAFLNTIKKAKINFS